MKKLFLIAFAMAAGSASAQIIAGVVAYDGVVIVSGASAPAVVYNEPVVYNAPVNYEGPVIYNAPVVYNNGSSINVISSGYDRPYGYAGAEIACPPPIIYAGGSQCNYQDYSSCSPNVIYFGRHSAAHGGYYLRGGCR